MSSETLEVVKDKLLTKFGFSLDIHGNKEAKILLSEGKDDHKLHRLRKMYIHRLKSVMRVMNDETIKARANETIKNLEAQNA